MIIVNYLSLLMKDKVVYLFLALFLATTTFFYLNKVFSFHFVDEEHNFTLGKNILKGEVLYEDFFTNHQPIEAISSALVQKISDPLNISQLVKRHRQAIQFYILLGYAFILFYFGKKIIPFVISFELSRFYLLGNLFLSETLVIFPLLIIEGLIIWGTASKFTSFLFGLCLTICLFLLAPIWPLLIFSSAIYLFKTRSSIKKHFAPFSLGIILVLSLVIPFMDPEGYFRYAIQSNLQYTVAATSYFGPWYVTTPQAFIAPWISWLGFPQGTETQWIIRLLSIILTLQIIFALKRKAYFNIFLILAILGLSNLRFYPPGQQFYQGFHLLPWYSSLLFLVSSFSVINLPKKLTSILIILLIAFSGYFAQPLFKNHDLIKQFDINYSHQQYIGNIVEALRDSDDILYVFPDQWLIYWQSNAKQGYKSFGYYIWSSHMPELKQQVQNLFSNSTPTFFYCQHCQGFEMVRYLSQYKPIKRYGQNTDLYILPDKITQLTSKQRQLLEFYNMTID